MPEKKEKRYVSDNAQLIEEWGWDKNNEIGLEPYKLPFGSHTKVWWKCSKGHEWQTSPHTRRKSGCPYCSGKKVKQGYNDICTTHQDLVKEWNYEKNKNDYPQFYSKGSDKKVWWKCSKCNYEWQAIISSRTQGHGCPSCAKRKNGDLTRSNDIFTSYPKLLEEWDYELNKISPKMILASSEKKIHWVCKNCGHKWQQTPYNRSIRKSGCPVCANKVIIKGINDLTTLRADILKEWNYKRNILVNPENISIGSNKKVWWICEKGHEWEASVSNRCKEKSTGCPICDAERKTSMPETSLIYYLKPYFSDIIQSYKPKFMKRGELDIFIPSLSFAIEYDGERFHKSVERDVIKYNQCQENGIDLLRVREPGCPPLPEKYECYIRSSIYENTLDEMIQDVVAIINSKYNLSISPNVNVARDRSEILKLYLTIEKKNSFIYGYPELLDEWDYEKNQGISPNMFGKGSNIKVWWKCGKGHSWQTKINSRTSLGTGCPVCGRQKASVNKASKNSERLLKNHPLFTEYDTIRNIDIDIETLRIGSKKEVWWICSKCENNWKAQIYTRVQGFAKCPRCNN